MRLIVTMSILLGICIQYGCGADARYNSAAELRDAAAPLIAKAPASKGPPESGERREFIVDYLGSSDADLRGAAVEVLSTGLVNGRPIRASKFTDYLGEKNPPPVRAVALAYSLQGHTAHGEKRLQTDERLVEMKDSWTPAINRLANQEGIPTTTWLALVVGMSYVVCDGTATSLLSADNKHAFAERIAPLLEGPEEWRSTVVSTLGSLGADVASPVLQKWYQQEKDVVVRLVFVDNLGLLGLTDRVSRQQFMPLLDLARTDSDEKVRAKAALTTR